MTQHRFFFGALAARGAASLAALTLIAGSVSGSVPVTPAGLADPVAVGAPGQTSGTEQSAAAEPRLLGPTPGGQTVGVSLVLKQPHRLDLDAYLAGINDPASPNYHRYMTAAQYGARFGLPDDRLQSVERWADGAGLSVLAPPPQRTVLRLEARAEQVQELFGTQLIDYVDPATGIVFHLPATTPIVPAAIAGDVDGIAGLSTTPARSKLVRNDTTPRPNLEADPIGGFGPVDLARAYDIVPLYEAGFLGEGQTIAIMSFATFDPADIAKFDTTYGIDAQPVERVAVGPAITATNADSIEVALDIEVVHGIAPHATVLNFEAKNGGNLGEADMLDAIVADGRAKIVTESWGLCDITKYVRTAERTRDIRAMEAAVAAGVNYFVASGDTGAYTCWQQNPKDHTVVPSWPADSPFVIAVGGTHLTVRADGTYFAEAAWENYLRTASTGGGLNPVDARPAWQVGNNVDNSHSNGKRQVPDVAAVGDTLTGYSIYASTQGGNGWMEVGGTSASTPFWAAATALMQQFAATQGIDRLGFLNPVFYDLADQYPPDTIFHEVSRGGNLQDAASVGWDYAVGLGTPDVTALADAIVLFIKANTPQ